MPNFTPRQFSNSDVIRLSASDKRYLANLGRTHLLNIGFNEPQISYLTPYESRDNRGTVPEFLRGTEYDISEPVRFSYNSPDFTLNSESRHRTIQEILGINPYSREVPAPAPEPVEEEEEEVATPSEEVVSSIPTSETKHDLGVKFLDCYCKSGDKLVLIKDFVGNTVSAVYSVLTKSGRQAANQLKIFNYENFDMTLPTLGLINHEEGIILVERTHKKGSPARYRRAFRPDLIDIKDLNYREKAAIGRPSQLLEYRYDPYIIFKKVGHSIFFPEHFTFEEALEKVASFERLGAAFSSNYGIKLDSDINQITLVRYEFPIGFWNPKKEHFQMRINDFNKDLVKFNIPFQEAE